MREKFQNKWGMVVNQEQRGLHPAVVKAPKDQGVWPEVIKSIHEAGFLLLRKVSIRNRSENTFASIEFLFLRAPISGI